MPLTRDLAAAVASWFAKDEEGQRRLDTDFYGADLNWWLLVQECAARYGWVGVVGDEHVGFIDVEVEGDGRESRSTFVRSFVVTGSVNSC